MCTAAPPAVFTARSTRVTLASSSSPRPSSVPMTSGKCDARSAQLPPEEATLVRLQHLEGLTQSEIAQRMGIALGTVKSRTFRAHRRLAGLLGHLRDEPVEPPGAKGRKELTEEPPR